jgi:GAF domain-containing protein
MTVPTRYLQSIVDTARAIFDAQASSIFLVTGDAAELEFAAVAGRGERHLVGRRFPVDTGIAGWVVSTGQGIVVNDVDEDPNFDRDAARGTGFVPRAIVAAPVTSDHGVVGVIEVLDPTYDRRGSLAELDLLGRFAHQVALALEVLVDAVPTAAGSGSDLAALVAGLVEAAPAADLARAARILARLAVDRTGVVAAVPP